MCPHCRGCYVQASMEPETCMSLLEGCLHFYVQVLMELKLKMYQYADL